MTSEVQKQLIEVLAKVWSLSPDVRLGQLMAHLGFLGKSHLGRGLGVIEDDELMSILHGHLAELEARESNAPDSTLSKTA